MITLKSSLASLASLWVEVVAIIDQAAAARAG
jgi:hypothetical protein